MAQLGFRTIDEMIGRVDRLEMRDGARALEGQGARPVAHPAISRRLRRRVARCRCAAQDHGLDRALDDEIIGRAAAALEGREPVAFDMPIRNVNRTVGTMLGSEITRRYGGEGLPDDTIRVHFTGSAGQSFGAFLPRGVTLTLEGDANDFWGKGLSGGKLIVYPPRKSTFASHENVIIGNVALYGATSGEAYVRGVAGERFAVRNSGASAVVEGVGDHGCEYMTAGRVVVIGRTGRNFAAGMSGGIAYVLDVDGTFRKRCNQEMVDLEALSTPEDIETVRALLRRHVRYTNSGRAVRLLADWLDESARFVKIIPRDYRRVLVAEAEGAVRESRAGVCRTGRSVAWVTSPVSSTSSGRNHGSGRSPCACSTGTKCTCPPRRRKSAIRARAAWIAASRSVTRVARSETRSRTGTTSCIGSAGAPPAIACTPRITFPISRDDCVRRLAKDRACSASTTKR